MVARKAVVVIPVWYSERIRKSNVRGHANSPLIDRRKARRSASKQALPWIPTSPGSMRAAYWVVNYAIANRSHMILGQRHDAANTAESYMAGYR